MDKDEIMQVINDSESLLNINISGLMGMASFTPDLEKVRNEFKTLKMLFQEIQKIKKSNCNISILSMGMSADYKMALEEGSNMLRIGSILFGERPKL